MDVMFKSDFVYYIKGELVKHQSCCTYQVINIED
jgi:hypothetical protein